MRPILVGAMLLTIASGCAGISPVQIGQTVGTIAGAVLVPGGAPIGALVGMLTGMLVQGQVDKATETRERKELSERLTTGDGQPAMIAEAPPEPVGPPTRVWVDETVQEGRLVAGHFEVRRI